MTAWLDWLIVAFAAGTLVAGAWLLLLARRSLPALFLGLFVSIWGVQSLVGPAVAVLGVPFRAALVFLFLTIAAISATILSFAYVHPSGHVTKRRALVLFMVWGVAALVGATLVYTTSDITTSGGLDFDDPRFFPAGIWVSFGYLGALALLGLKWLRSPPGIYRTQVAWGLIPILFWNLHDGLGFSLYPAFFGPSYGLGWLVRYPWIGVVSFLSLLSVLLGLLIGAAAFLRVVRAGRDGAPAHDDRAVFVVTLYALPVTLVQVFDPNFGLFSGGRVSQLHTILDFAAVVLVVYGVARYNVVDLDLRIKWGLRKSTVAAAFVAAFFFASETAGTFFSDAIGPYAGLGAAALLVFAIAPLHRAADAIAERAMPRVRETAEYLDGRKATIYRGALEGLLRDGVVSAKERATLLRLQEDLALDAREANRIETDVLARMTAA